MLRSILAVNCDIESGARGPATKNLNQFLIQLDLEQVFVASTMLRQIKFNCSLMHEQKVDENQALMNDC
jgi:hypothetical protein